MEQQGFGRRDASMSPIFVRALTAAEQKALSELIRRENDARVVRRAQMVRLSATGMTTPQIAAMWDVNDQTVRRTLRRFEAEGIEGLRDKPRKGRPAKKTERYIALLREAVQTSPRELGYPFSSWTLERLREHLALQTGIRLHPNSLSRIMAENDIVYRRPKHSMEHLRDPAEYNEKQAILDFLKRGRFVPQPASTCSTSMSVRFTSTRP
jgi:transposase